MPEAVKLKIGLCLGCNDWKHATGKGGGFIKHDNYQHYKTAFLNWTQYMANVSSGTSVASSLDTARKEQVEKNRHYLKTVIWAIMFCATQEIALCSHREGMSSNNKGNFLEVIDLLAM